MSAPTPGTGISQDDIDSVKEAQEEMMPELVTVYDRVEAKDSRGGTKITYAARTPQIIGRVGKVKDTSQFQFEGTLRGKANAILTVPVGSGVVQNCRVAVLGRTYNVTEDLSQSSYSTASRYGIEEV